MRRPRRGLERFGVGNCESRLLGGNLEIYDALEAKIAAMKDKDASVLFATGYLTNLGVLSSLPRAGQYARIYGYRAKSAARYAYFSDQFNHLSIREGIRASGLPREDIWVTTKVTEENAKADDFARSVDTSLKTLGLDYVDLLLIHWQQPKVPLEETLGALPNS